MEINDESVNSVDIFSLYQSEILLNMMSNCKQCWRFFCVVLLVNFVFSLHLLAALA